MVRERMSKAAKSSLIASAGELSPTGSRAALVEAWVVGTTPRRCLVIRATVTVLLQGQASVAAAASVGLIAEASEAEATDSEDVVAAMEAEGAV